MDPAFTVVGWLRSGRFALRTGWDAQPASGVRFLGAGGIVV